MLPKYIEFRDEKILYHEDYDRYETIKQFSSDSYSGNISLNEYDHREFQILHSKDSEHYSIRTWLLAHLLGAPNSDCVHITKNISSKLNYSEIPELVKDAKFLKGTKLEILTPKVDKM